MKTFSLLLSSITLAVTAASAAPMACPCPTRFAFNVSEVNAGQSIVRAGAAEKDVLAILGAPRSATGSVWMYKSYHAREALVPDRPDCTTLVVTFSSGIVSDLKLVTPAAAEHIATQIKLGKAIAYSSRPLPAVALNR